MFHDPFLLVTTQKRVAGAALILISVIKNIWGLTWFVFSPVLPCVRVAVATVKKKEQKKNTFAAY